mmetsp:Transcript_19429/g.55893  ORF Transcript_19429/g.55893 Transcript_19429/m.55893 type:complete len:287 (+) Transcript_19429:1828-2688(+)
MGMFILGVAARARAVMTIVVGVVRLLSGQLAAHGLGTVLFPFLNTIRKFITNLVWFVARQLVEDVIAFAVRKARTMRRWSRWEGCHRVARINRVDGVVIVWLIRCGNRQVLAVGFGFLAQCIGKFIEMKIVHAVLEILAIVRLPVPNVISAPSQVVARISSIVPVRIVAVIPRVLAGARTSRHMLGATPLFAFQIPLTVRILVAVSRAQTTTDLAVAVLPGMFMQFFFVPTVVIRIVVMVLSLVGLAKVLLVLGSFLGLVLAFVDTAIFALALLATVHAARYRRGG